MAFIEPISRDASRPEFGLVSPVPGAAGYARPTWHILVAGTQIMTPKGAQAVDLIAIGDEVATRDHGMQPVLDVRVRRMGRQSLIAAPRQTPVSVGMGAFGTGLPVHTFWAHPMMIIATGSGERPPPLRQGHGGRQSCHARLSRRGFLYRAAIGHRSRPERGRGLGWSAAGSAARPVPRPGVNATSDGGNPNPAARPAGCAWSGRAALRHLSKDVSVAPKSYNSPNLQANQLHLGQVALIRSIFYAWSGLSDSVTGKPARSGCRCCETADVTVSVMPMFWPAL